MTTNHVGIVAVTKELAAQIEVLRFDKKKSPDGFQRKLNEDRVSRAAVALSKGDINCPPIMLGRINNRLVCIDGQHRLESWKLKPFPLQAVINHYGNLDDAARTFDAINANSVRVGLQHRLQVSPVPFFAKIRALATKLGVTNIQVYWTMYGLGDRRKTGYNFSPEEWGIAERVIKLMKKDERWGSKRQVYSSTPTLRMVAYFARQSKDIERLVKNVGTMNFVKSATFAALVGHGSGKFNSLRQHYLNHCARRGLI